VGVLVAPGKLRARRLARLTGILEQAPVLTVDRRVAAHYVQLRAASGRPPANDLWIAATALAHELTLLTADTRPAALPGVQATLVTRVAEATVAAVIATHDRCTPGDRP
jgi:predicted nucleic acid-binding protein